MLLRTAGVALAVVLLLSTPSHATCTAQVVGNQFVINDCDVVISGGNLFVQNGMGSTATTNGKGNIIVGYNEPRSNTTPADRAGSHNLIVGVRHHYPSYAGMALGRQNTVSGPYSSVTGGGQNIASGNRSSVSGGQGNVASGDYSSAAGGAYSIAGGLTASVSGGANNVASGELASVSGGQGNTASGTEASVSGGENVTVSAAAGWAGGGSEHNP